MMKAHRFLGLPLLAASLWFSAPACATRSYGYGGPRDYPPRVYATRAREAGYRDGFEVGRSDARHRDRYDPVRASRYRSADHDYDSRYGPRDDYRREYRNAFEQGYAEGYRTWR